MNYLRHYTKLIRKAEERRWVKNSTLTYVEEHHTFPKSVYGGNSRTVLLTGREHFVAHVLLWKGFEKRYGASHWKTIKMALAVTSMGMSKSGQRHPTSHQVEQMKLARSKATSGDLHWSRQPGRTNPFVELNKNPERAARIGEQNRQYQNKLVEEGVHHFLDPEWQAAHGLSQDDCAKGGRKSGKLPWWTNGVKTTRSLEKPGDGWKRGRKLYLQ